MTRRPPNAVSTSTIPGGSVLTSPISAAASSCSRRAASVSSAASGATKATNLPSFATYIGSMPSSSAAPDTAGAAGTSPSRTTIATPAARAISLSTEATPPRVASRRQWTAGPRIASPAGHSARVSETMSAASPRSPRASMIAVPCSPIEPETRMRSPGRTALGDSAARGSRAPTPVVHTYMPSACPRSTTFVSPATMRTSAASAARAIASTSARSTSASSPSSRISARLSASGRAPPIARSLTVPFTASSPIEPPGNRSGLTTNESVVSAMPSTTAASASSSIPKAGARSPSISVCVALPPAPWAIVMRSSLKRGRFARAVSMIPRIRSSRDGALTREPSVVVVGGARPLGGDHARPDRVLGGARGAEDLALPRLDDALEHLAALACLRVGDPHARDAEALLGVEGRVGVREAQRALRDEPQAPPLEVRAQREDLGEHLERAQVALVGHDAAVLVLDLAATLLQLAEDHHERLQDVERLEARHHERLAVVRGDELERPRADHGRHVPRPDEAVEPQVRRVEQRAQRRQDRDVVAQAAEVGDALEARPLERQGGRRRRRLEADRQEDDLAIRVGLREAQRVER